LVSVKKLTIGASVAVVAGLSLATSAFAGAAATSLFASESNARSVCGQTNVVWAVFDSGRYYKPGSPGYEWGKGERKGAYTCEKAAKSKGWHLAKNIQ
jgi:hypothetical protein